MKHVYDHINLYAITIHYKLKISFPNTHSYIIHSIKLVRGLKSLSIKCCLANMR